jgi:AraC-like DNA-binding protein
MDRIVVIDDNFGIYNLVIKCLENTGFEINNTQNGHVRVNLAQDKLSNSSGSKKLNTSQSILPSNSRLREVFEFIELNYNQNIKLKEVAKAVGYSSAYLTDLVRKLTGKTVNDWIIERRIVEASTLLVETNYSVNEIAEKVGYQNINHFYCQFRNYHKTTPRSWREAQLTSKKGLC